MLIYGSYGHFYPEKLIFFKKSKNHEKVKKPTYCGSIMSKIKLDLCFNTTNVPVKSQSDIYNRSKVIRWKRFAYTHTHTHTHTYTHTHIQTFSRNTFFGFRDLENVKKTQNKQFENFHRYKAFSLRKQKTFFPQFADDRKKNF